MGPAEFLKKIQARQDTALANRKLNKPTVTVQRVRPLNGSQARLIISCDKPGYLVGVDAKKIWSEVTQNQGGTVTVTDSMNLEVRISGSMNMYKWLELFLTRLLCILAYNGAESFHLHGEWDKVQVKTGSFNRSEVQMSYFNTLE